MNKFVFYGHGGCLNHGCEAIVKTTINILRKEIPDFSLDISTIDVVADKKFNICADNFISSSNIPTNFFTRYSMAFIMKILKKPELITGYMYSKLFNKINKYDKDSIWFSIGGDNYCTANPYWLYQHNDLIDKNKISRVLWGCSVEPETINQKMIEDLSKYKLITTRETLTYNALIEKGVKTNISLYPDPAFTLETDLTCVPKDVINNQTIGINLSPVIMQNEKISGIAYKSYYNLIGHIIKNTDYNIALIPHVVIANNNDYDTMNELYNSFKDTNRVTQISQELSASQYKGIISKCVMFIGARTHATIAAYSSCVPTLVIGYSVKAKGIAKDIFGSYEDYVIPVQNIEDDKQLIGIFDKFNERKDDDKNHLIEFIPNYTKKAWEAALDVKKILN